VLQAAACNGCSVAFVILKTPAIKKWITLIAANGWIALNQSGVVKILVQKKLSACLPLNL